MGFKSASEFSDGSVLRKRTAIEGDVVFATHKASRKESSGTTYTCTFLISKSKAEEARLLKGDFVDFLFDREKNLGLIKRSTKVKRWTIRDYHVKRFERYILTINWMPGMPSVAESAACPAEITEEGILFQLPKGTKYDTNARSIP
jgi:hypothetical protein